MGRPFPAHGVHRTTDPRAGSSRQGVRGATDTGQERSWWRGAQVIHGAGGRCSRAHPRHDPPRVDSGNLTDHSVSPVRPPGPPDRPGSPTSRFTLLEKLNASARVPLRRIHTGFEPGGGYLSEPSRRWRVRREGHTHEKSPGLTPGLVADSSRTIRAERLRGPASGRDKVSDAPSGSLEDQLPPPLVVVGEAGGFGRVGTGGVGTFTLADCWMADGIPTGITTVLATTEAAAGSNIWPPHTS